MLETPTNLSFLQSRMVVQHTRRRWQISSKSYAGSMLSLPLPLRPQRSTYQLSRMQIAKNVMMVTHAHVNRQDAILLAWDPNVYRLFSEGQVLGEKIV
jgi:hypothetical protein